MAENRLLRTNPLASRTRQYAGMSVIFRQEESTGGTVVPASSPVVPGFLWTPELWAASAETAIPAGESTAEATTEAVAETTAVPSTTAPPVQRQPESASAATPPMMDTAVPEIPVSPQPTPAPTGADTAVAVPSQSPPIIQHHTDVNESEAPAPSVQLAPSDGGSPALEITTVAPTAPAPTSPATPPSLLGRIGQRLGRLVSRPQPATTPPAASPTRVETAGTPAPSAAEAAVSTPPAPQPATPPAVAPVQRQPVESESERSSTTAVAPNSPTMPMQGQPETAAGTTAVSPAAAQRVPEAPVASVPTPSGSIPVAPAAAPTPVQRQPEIPAAPIQRPPETAVSPTTGADITSSTTTATGPVPAVPTTSVSPIPPAAPTTSIPAAPPIQRQPAGEAPALPAAPIAPTPVPSSVPAPGASAAPTPLPAQAQPPVTQAPVSQPPVSQPPIAHPSVTSQPAVQRQPETAPTAEEDRNWRRLETIMRRHKEQGSAEAANVEAAAPGIEPPTAPASEPPLPSFARPKPAAKPSPGVVSRQPAAPPREAPMVAVARGRGPVKGETAVSPDTAPSSAPSPAEPPLTETAVTRPTMPSPAAPTVRRAEADDDTLYDDTLLAAPGETALPGVGETGATGEGPEAVSPLQAVWPVQTVQRAEAPTTASATPAARGASPFPMATEPPVRPATTQDFWVEERLATVPPGMPTDSSVPLLRPRRPRPSRPTTPSASMMDMPYLVAESGGTAVPPTVQRQPEAATGGLVPTEIGALPPDLWTLIGQPPPAVAPVAAPEAQAPPSTATVMAKQEGDGATAVASGPQTPPVSTPDLSDYLQLEEEGEAGAASGVATAVPGEGDEEAGEKKEGEEIDINELARQVYTHLRGQLLIDRERERGRLIHKW